MLTRVPQGNWGDPTVRGDRDEPVDRRESYEGPVHVYLGRPLAGRTVIDGHSRREIPFRNVYAEIKAMWSQGRL